MDQDEIEQLKEELLCQQVMLASLVQMDYEGVEEERAEIRQEIGKLKKSIERASRGEDTNQSAAVDDNENEPAGSQVLGAQSGRATPDRSLRDDTPGALPAQPHTPPMPSPRGQHERQNSATYSLPSRKRERTHTLATGRDSTAKSRRTAQASSSRNPFHSSPLGGSSAQDYDVIDLTRDDNIDPRTIALQEKEAAKRRQEADDAKLAWDMYRAVESRGSSSSPTPAAQNNGLDRIMNTQRLNGPGNESYERPVPGTSHLPPLSSFVGPAQATHHPTMPGAFPEPQTLSAQHPSANGSYSDRASFPAPNNGRQQAHGALLHGTHSLYSMSPMGAHSNGYPTPSGPVLGSSPASYQPRNVGFTPAGTLHQQQGPSRTPGFPHGARPPPIRTPMRPDGLGSIIDLTSHFDYARGLDSNGNPLSERLTNYLDDVMHDTRVSEQELDELLQNIRPDMDIPEANRDGTPEGLKGTLYHHQELALSWAKKMEAGSSKGGILADDMGLGKTISMLSLMLERKATSRPKTNLIVAPLALLRQWEEEIKTKVKPSHKLSTYIHHGKKTTTDEILKYDVVLTTYGTLAAEAKRLEKFLGDNRDRQVDMNEKGFMAKCPLLHPEKAVFHRVILDEAQCIKNEKTQTAKAAFQLQAKFRWCLTGTPMMNGIFELFSLIHFLKIKPYCEWKRFREAFGTLFGKGNAPKASAMSRLRALLKAIMLRRKKDSTLDGKPIVRLPKKTEGEEHVELGEDERDFYYQLEKKAQVQFNKYLREGTVGKNYSNILVLLLRLRQACCHPHLNLDVGDRHANPANISDEEMDQIVAELDPGIVNRIKEMESFECPICYDAVESPCFFVPCGHDSCTDCLSRLIDSAQTTSIQEGDETATRSKCPVCRGIFDPKKCFTHERFRKMHMPEASNVKDEDDGEAKKAPIFESETESGTEDGSDDDSDDSDVDEQGNLRDFIVPDEEADGSNGTPQSSKSKKKKTVKKGKGKEKVKKVQPSELKALRKEAAKNRQAYKRYMKYLKDNFMTSAKVMECMFLLRSIEEESGEKVIIFSQWTLLLDLLQVAMGKEGFSHKPQRYDGSMSATSRNDAATAFRSDPRVKVILVSLRAGNAGLNLTAASRVIIMDPFWNPYIEMQAVDRAYRIGQQREVKVHRILTKETVEDRIIDIQNRKKEMVEAALDETESKKIGRLTVSELKYLFNGSR